MISLHWLNWEISGTLNYMKPREFCLVTVLEGEGQMIVDGEIFKLTTGTNFILTSEDWIVSLKAISH